MTPRGHGRKTVAAKVPPIAVTMGDPAGVGPEIIALAMEDELCLGRCVLVGDIRRLREGARRAGSSVAYREVGEPAEAATLSGEVGVIQVDLEDPSLPFGLLSPAGGECAYRCLVRAIDMAMDGSVSGLATAPLNKEALHLAGHRYPGHTEILAERTGASDVVMMLAAGPMRVLHVTAHMAMAQVPTAITGQRILRVLKIGRDALVRMGVPEPRFAVAGLNPHAGEGGLFGKEEVEVIGPSVERARGLGYSVAGPIPPDIVFLKMNQGHYDAVVAMYHDQGHIPLKLLAFESGVNVSLGLPIVRTSVDHGTAYDIAGKGLADPGSLIEAIRLAIDMTGVPRP